MIECTACKSDLHWQCTSTRDDRCECELYGHPDHDREGDLL